MDLTFLTLVLSSLRVRVGLSYRKHDRLTDSPTTAYDIPTRRASYADRSRSDSQSEAKSADIEQALRVGCPDI